VTAPVERVLIVRLGALGDAVHAIPVAAALRRAYPKAEIHWLVSARHRELLDLVTCLDRIIAVNDRAGAQGGVSLVGAISALRRVQYDAVLDLQGLVKSAVLARLSGSRRVVGFTRRYAREPLARLFYTEEYDPGGAGLYARTEFRHVVHLNLGMLERLGVQAGPLEFPIAEVTSPVADEIRLRTGGRYALLNPGAAWPNKRWPPPRFAGLSQVLARQMGLSAVVLWGPGEREIAEEIVDRSAGAAILSPRTTIADLVALARGATVMVSGDTGPTHLAAAVGTPIVGIYGPTRPQRNGPWSSDDVTLTRDDQCVCLHVRRCVAAKWCLLDLPIEEVLEGVQRRLHVSQPADA